MLCSLNTIIDFLAGVLIAILVPPQASAHTPPLTIEETIEEVSYETGVATSTLYNLAFSESSLDPLKKNYNSPTDGCPEGSVDRGLVAINDCYHPEVEDVCAYNARCSLMWAASRIKAGYAYEWVVCNCYALVRSTVPNLPVQSKLKPNGPPQEGGVVIMEYRGVPHYALILKLGAKTMTIKESNYIPCAVGKREVEYTDRHIKGFYSPDSG